MQSVAGDDVARKGAERLRIAAAVAPTQPDKVEVSRLTPSRAKISA